MDTDKVRELLRAGMGYKAIAAQVGCTQDEVRSYARSLPDLPVVKRSPWRFGEEGIAKKMLSMGRSFEDIAKVLPGRTAKAIKDKQYHEWRIPLREDLWTAEEEELGKFLLSSGTRLEMVADVLGRTRCAVAQKNTSEWNVRVPHGNNALAVETAFDTWSPIMSYILGFMVSDGNVSKDGKGISWAQSHDYGKSHLEKLLPFVGGNVYGPCPEDGYRLVVYSEKLNAKLQSMGIPPKKSLVMGFPAVPDEFLDHFIRGVFDGDGCVRDCASKKRNEPPRLQIRIASASEIFRKGLIERLRPLGYNGSECRIEVVFNHRESSRLAEWVWARKEDAIWMEKKYTKYLEVLKARAAHEK
jgi:hypothetical protein